MDTTTPIDRWLRAAVDDARRRGLGELEPLLETLARSTTTLREAHRVAQDDVRPPDATNAPGGGHG